VIKNWINNFVGFFKLIGDRKVTEAHGLLPKSIIPYLILVVFIGLIIIAHFYADPIYRSWFEVNNTDDPTSIYTKTTDLAQVHWVLVPYGIAILIISVWKMHPKSNADLLKWHHCLMGLYFVFTAVAFSGLITLLLKNVFGRVRPNFYDGVNLWQSMPFAGKYDFLSFPSGHATTAGAIAMIAYFFAPRFTLLGLGFAIWIAITRLGVGAHYPADVVAGLFVGMSFTWLYARSFARKRMLFKFTDNGKLIFRTPYGSS